MKYVLVYESGGADVEKLQQHLAAHRARWAEFRDAGTLLMIGPYSDRSGALAVFTTREAAEAFAAGDPFVLEGLIGAWQIHEWMEALVPD